MPARIQSTKGHDLYAFNTALKRNLKNAIYIPMVAQLKKSLNTLV